MTEKPKRIQFTTTLDPEILAARAAEQVSRPSDHERAVPLDTCSSEAGRGVSRMYQGRHRRRNRRTATLTDKSDPRVFLTKCPFFMPFPKIYGFFRDFSDSRIHIDGSDLTDCQNVLK